MKSLFIFGVLSTLAFASPPSSFASSHSLAQKPLISDAEVPIPPLGFGTWNLQVSAQNTSGAVSAAIQAGYRHIDCAAAYYNQEDVGKGIAAGLAATGLKREDLWITSKLWNIDHDPKRVEAALTKTLDQLGLEYLDLYLMHWPVSEDPGSSKTQIDYVDTWKALTILKATNRVRHIGVCNFSPHQLKRLISSSTQKPEVHQMEIHPYLPQTKWIKFHQKHDIIVTAYSPLGNQNPTYDSRPFDGPKLLENEDVKKIAERAGCTPAQAVLQWGMKRGVVVIPKTKHLSRVHENFDSLKCNLGDNDFKGLSKIQDTWTNRFNNPSKQWGVELFKGLDF